MNNIHLSILGSLAFLDILNELEFNNILNQNNISNHRDKKILVKVLFVENLKIKEVKNNLLKNEPIILFLLFNIVLGFKMLLNSSSVSIFENGADPKILK